MIPLATRAIPGLIETPFITTPSQAASKVSHTFNRWSSAPSHPLPLKDPEWTAVFAKCKRYEEQPSFSITPNLTTDQELQKVKNQLGVLEKIVAKSRDSMKQSNRRMNHRFTQVIDLITKKLKTLA